MPSCVTGFCTALRQSGGAAGGTFTVFSLLIGHQYAGRPHAAWQVLLSLQGSTLGSLRHHASWAHGEPDAVTRGPFRP